ncbi:hypothetical protein HK405_001954, partial [Cladochytrium tenue]
MVVEEFDRNPDAVLEPDNPVQLAALLKKFLRMLPEPLLTFKLYPLIMASQKLPDFQAKLVLHLIYVLLPKTNLDLLLVLTGFLREVSAHCQEPGGAGNKMDTHNLALVVAPNILYAKPPGGAGPAGPSPDDSMLAVKAVEMMIVNLDDLRL